MQADRWHGPDTPRPTGAQTRLMQEIAYDALGEHIAARIGTPMVRRWPPRSAGRSPPSHHPAQEVSMKVTGRKFELEVNETSFHWDLDAGTVHTGGRPLVMFWLDPSLLRMLLPLVDEV